MSRRRIFTDLDTERRVRRGRRVVAAAGFAIWAALVAVLVVSYLGGHL